MNVCGNFATKIPEIGLKFVTNSVKFCETFPKNAKSNKLQKLPLAMLPRCKVFFCDGESDKEQSATLCRCR